MIEKETFDPKSTSVVVIGQGYVGLPLSLAAHDAGWNVTGLDTNENLVKKLRLGQSHIADISDVKLKESLKTGFRIDSEAKVIEKAQIIVICVPTPLDSNGKPDLKVLRSAIHFIALFAKEGTLVINESTSFPGTVRDLIPSLIRETSPDLSLLYATAPERVDPGNENWTYRTTPRLVAGLTEESHRLTFNFYSSFCDNVIEVSKPEVAELAKLLENSFRQVNIGLVNELVPIAKSFGANIFEVIEAATTKPYGYTPFYPGVGVGGHCIPVDPMYLSWAAKERGLKTSIIDAANNSNEFMPNYVANLVRTKVSSIQSRILVVGLSYKRGIADLRESPSVDLILDLEREFYKIEWWDEVITKWRNKDRSKLDQDYDLIVVTHKVFEKKLLDFISKAARVLDCTGQFRNLANTETI